MKNANWAVKYRPDSFEGVVGQDSVVKAVKKIAELKNVPAILLCGQSGVGKTTLLRIYGKSIVGSNSGLDFLEIDAAASGNVEKMRELERWCESLPQVGEYKMVVIDEVHALTREAGTVLLSMVEEPNSFVRFGFATTDPNKVLPTVLGRSMVFPLKRIPAGEVISKLNFIANNEGVSFPEDVIAEVGYVSGGQLRNAIRLLQQLSYLDNPSKSDVRRFVGLPAEICEDEFLSLVFKGDIDGLSEYCNVIYEQGSDVASFAKSLVLYLDRVVSDRFKSGLIDAETSTYLKWMQSLIGLYKEAHDYPALAPSVLRAWCAKILGII